MSASISKRLLSSVTNNLRLPQIFCSQAFVKVCIQQRSNLGTLTNHSSRFVHNKTNFAVHSCRCTSQTHTRPSSGISSLHRSLHHNLVKHSSLIKHAAPNIGLQGLHQNWLNLPSLSLRKATPSVAHYSSKKINKMANVSAILKNQSALQVTKPARKKAPKISELGKTAQMDNVVAYAMAEEINLEGLETHLMNQGLYRIGEMPQDVVNALHVQGKYNVDQKPKEIFVFRDGSVVFWCVPEIERGAFIKMLSKYSVAPYVTSLVIYEREELDFKFTGGKSGLEGDTIHLRQVSNRRQKKEKLDQQPMDEEELERQRKEEREEEYQRFLEMYTFSNAMSQSVKLAIWEASLSNYVTSIVDVTEDLRHGNKIRMSRKQVLMKTGELFSLRHLINLSSDLLDTPDFYWDRGGLEPLYLSLCNHLNIARRTRVMNEKLSHCCELTELLSSQLSDAHHTRLEVMIIVLIMVEVVFECIHYAERLLRSKDVTASEATQASEAADG